jgi:DNA-binding NarL/FixJ family response regulator
MSASNALAVANQPDPEVSILIADDHELIRLSLRDLLELKAGWSVCGEAVDGQAAVSMATTLHPDVAILDVRMPVLNGLDAARLIHRACPAVEILILTGQPTERLLAQAFEAGAHGVALKGEGAAQILSAVEAVASHQVFVGWSGPVGWEAPVHAERSPLARLSDRERQVSQLLAEGKTNQSVATILGIGVKTVETHRANLLMKLGLESVVELVHFAVRNGLIDP